MLPRPNSTSTRSGAPAATSVAVADRRPERHHLAGLRQVGDGAGLGHVDRVAPHRQPGRDDVAERDLLGDVAVEFDVQHAVVVPVGDQEPAAVRLQRVLDPVGSKNSVAGGFSADHVPMSAMTVKLFGPSTR